MNYPTLSSHYSHKTHITHLILYFSLCGNSWLQVDFRNPWITITLHSAVVGHVVETTRSHHSFHSPIAILALLVTSNQSLALYSLFLPRCDNSSPKQGREKWSHKGHTLCFVYSPTINVMEYVNWRELFYRLSIWHVNRPTSFGKLG